MTTHPRAPDPHDVIAPPFTLETATQKTRLAEDAWNSRDPARVARGYTEGSVWRSRGEFLVGRDRVRAFLADNATGSGPSSPTNGIANSITGS